MKKFIPKKLHVNKETIRSLATHELTHVVGGDEALYTDTGRTVCPPLAIVAIAPK